MTGQNMLKGTRISEADELPNLMLSSDLCKDSDLEFFRQKLQPSMYIYVINSFRSLQGIEKRVKDKSDLDTLVYNYQNTQET